MCVSDVPRVCCYTEPLMTSESSQDEPRARILDNQGLMFLYRSDKPVLSNGALESLRTAIPQFVEACLARGQVKSGCREGDHFSVILGVDRHPKPKAVDHEQSQSGNNFLSCLHDKNAFTKLLEDCPFIMRLT